MTTYASILVGFATIMLGTTCIVAVVFALAYFNAPRPDPFGFTAGCILAAAALLVATVVVVDRVFN